MPQPSSFENINSWWSKLPVYKRGAIVIAIPAFCWVVTISTWVWSRQNGRVAIDWIEHTQTVLTESDRLLVELLDAEIAIRSYSLIQNDDFLKDYQRALTQLPVSIARLKQLTRNNSQQYKLLVEIEGLSQQKTETLQEKLESIPKNRSLGELSPQLPALIARGEKLMDELRVTIARFKTEEQRLLDLRREKLSQIRQITTILQWSSVGISFLGYLAAMCLFRDLELELQERERRLYESKTLIQSIVGNVVDGVITLDNTDKIETFNTSAAKIFGYEPEEVTGKNLQFLLDDPGQENSDRELSLLRGQPCQTTAYRKSGAPFPIEISISDMPLDNRKIAIIRDISDRYLAQQQLQERASELSSLNSILAERNRELDQFAYIVSHDLKAPLRAISSLSQWIEEDLGEILTEETQEQMNLLRGRVKRMENLINGILQYSRVGRTKIDPEIVDVNQLLKEVIDLLSPPPEFTIAIEGEMPTFITTRVLLEQVFVNLIGNAIFHHDRTDGRVTVTSIERGNYYEFAIADDGVGIAPENQEKVFAIFQTLEARDKVESTGIGLAIVKKIIEAQGGKIEIESQLGEGCTFRFIWLK